MQGNELVSMFSTLHEDESGVNEKFIADLNEAREKVCAAMSALESASRTINVENAYSQLMSAINDKVNSIS